MTTLNRHYYFNTTYSYSPFGGLLIDLYGLTGMRLSYLIAGLLGVAAAWFRTKFLKETFTSEEKKVPGNIIENISKSFYKTLYVFKEVPKPVLLVLTVSVIFSTPSVVVLFLYSVVYAREVVKVSMSEWGIYNSLASISSLVTGLLATRVIEKYERRFFTALSGFTLGAIYLLLYFIPSPWTICLTLILFRVIGSLYTSSWGAYIVDMVKPEFRGRIYALINIFDVIGYTWSSLFFGYLYSINYGYAFKISSLFAFIDALVLFFIMKSDH